eukprot:11196272-Lingulodinium_polyedra.AAC.1
MINDPQEQSIVNNSDATQRRLVSAKPRGGAETLAPRVVGGGLWVASGGFHAPRDAAEAPRCGWRSCWVVAVCGR